MFKPQARKREASAKKKARAESDKAQTHVRIGTHERAMNIKHVQNQTASIYNPHHKERRKSNMYNVTAYRQLRLFNPQF